MNNISKLASFLFGIFALVAFTSCSDDEEPERVLEPGTAIEDANGNTSVMLSRKTAYGNDWIYFSFKEGKEITVAEETHADDLSWDLAFNRYNIRTNSGLSGKGQGGAIDTGLTDINAVMSVPEGEWTVDTKAMITGSFTGSGITEVESTLNEKLGEAIKFQGPPPTYTPNNHVYIVRTADGKFVKIKVLGFHDNMGKSGFVSFQYKAL